MSTNLPVPSKAAITALRGLVLGTSCTLALVAEDRRRRINNAVDAIETRRKLKSSRQYHGGGTQFALALEDDPDALSFPFEPTVRITAKTQRTVAERRRTELLSRSTEVLRASEVASAAVSTLQNHRWDGDVTPAPEFLPEARPAFIIRRLTSPPKSNRAKRASMVGATEIAASKFPSTDHIVSRVHLATSSGDEEAMNEVLQLVLTAYKGRIAPDNQQKRWVQATGLLCRALSGLGRVQDASILLQKVVSRGKLDEADYLGHSPLELIDLLLAQEAPSRLDNGHSSYLSQLDLAASLFLPTFTKKPQSRNADVVAVGRKLLECAFAAERLKQVEEIYWRCLSYEGDNAWQLAESFVTQLHESQNHQLAIRYFLLSYCKMTPPTESIQEIGNVVIDAVEASSNYKVAQVLRALPSLCSGICQLRTQWPMKLFTYHWQKHKDYGQTLVLFNELMNSGLKELVPHSDCLYRIMIEIALEAGEEHDAESFFDQLKSEDFKVANDVRILGRFALSKARRGDWEAVQRSFEAMHKGGRRGKEYYSNVFVPILKVFAKEHSVAETDQFLRLYIDDLEVPVSQYMVALVANKYGSQRDLSSFRQWLEYCTGVGFKIDGAFANAFLVNCKRRWGFSFADLRRIFLNLRTLSPDCVDKTTEHIMVDAAIADGNGPAARGRVVSLGVDPIKLARRGKCASERDVVLAMREALACSRPARAVKIYKRALHLGMPFSSYALRLAVQASLAINEGNFKMAISLLQDARSDANDLSEAIVYIMAAQLKTIPLSRGKPDFLVNVQETVEQFESKGIALSEAILHKIAALCLRARHYRGAISYAVRAAEAGGKPGPCYNLTSFKILLEGYARLADVEGIRCVVAMALSSNYREKAACTRQLKFARSLLKGQLAAACTNHAEVYKGIKLLDDAIDQAKSFREQLATERETLEDDIMQIMKQAALNADATAELDKMLWIERPPRIKHEDAELEDLWDEVLAEDIGGGNMYANGVEDSSVDVIQAHDAGEGSDGMEHLRSVPEKRRFEVKVRPKKPNSGSSSHIAGSQNDDPLSFILERARLEESGLSARKFGAVGW